MGTETLVENGIYKSENATYFVKDGKIIMKLQGEYYKTTSNFMVGATKGYDLPEDISISFNEAYEQCKQW